MDHSIQELIHRRYSCRAYVDEPIRNSDQKSLKDYLHILTCGPLGTPVRFEFIAATQDDRQSLKGLGTYGFIKNPMAFIVGTAEKGSKDLEDYGYMLERAILAATDLEINTCWLGGSFTQSGFAKKMMKREQEIIPAVAAAGYSTATKTPNGQIRNFLGATRRLPVEQIFFRESFGTPLLTTGAGAFAPVLELVRRAPSASNRQPWRIILIDDVWHFYLQRTQGYGKGTLVFKILKLADLQRVDMGIAMCHFELAAGELGMRGSWFQNEPAIPKPDSAEYTMSWKQEK